MYISADGDVRACGNLDQTIGNIRDKKIMDLWHSDVMIALRKKPSAIAHIQIYVPEDVLEMTIGVKCSISTQLR